VYELEPVLFGERQRVGIGVVVGLTVQDDFAAERAHGIDLDAGRCLRHDDERLDAEPAGRERDTLGVIARRAADDAALEPLARNLRETVFGAAALEGKDWLQVFALEKDLVVETRGKAPRVIERRLDGARINLCVRDARYDVREEIPGGRQLTTRTAAGAGDLPCAA
jgi:hypothetical protein